MCPVTHAEAPLKTALPPPPSSSLLLSLSPSFVNSFYLAACFCSWMTLPKGPERRRARRESTLAPNRFFARARARISLLAEWRPLLLLLCLPNSGRGGSWEYRRATKSPPPSCSKRGNSSGRELASTAQHLFPSPPPLRRLFGRPTHYVAPGLSLPWSTTNTVIHARPNRLTLVGAEICLPCALPVRVCSVLLCAKGCSFDVDGRVCSANKLEGLWN